MHRRQWKAPSLQAAWYERPFSCWWWGNGWVRSNRTSMVVGVLHWQNMPPHPSKTAPQSQLSSFMSMQPCLWGTWLMNDLLLALWLRCCGGPGPQRHVEVSALVVVPGVAVLQHEVEPVGALLPRERQRQLLRAVSVPAKHRVPFGSEYTRNVGAGLSCGEVADSMTATRRPASAPAPNTALGKIRARSSKKPCRGDGQ